MLYSVLIVYLGITLNVNVRRPRNVLYCFSSSHLILHHDTSRHHISSHLISSDLISSSHLISSHPISFHFISSYLISSHPISSHLISSHLISFHLISSHLISSQNILSSEITRKVNYLSLCRKDYLMITNEKDLVFGKYCGQKTGQTVLVTGKYALIKFLSNSSIQQKGFVLSFTVVAFGKLIANMVQINC